ncbi:MAG: reverse transcriptase/maturase family protein [Patescibacteria group bacterium]|jgi:retron-type reverse transcriptase
MTKFDKKYDEIVTVSNLLLAWEKFLAGKRKRNDVAVFQIRLMDNIHFLHRDLKEKTYIHGTYQAFNISDPKPRNIHKATVRDRLLHHLLYRETYKYFNSRFINDSYSCRIGKGTHRAIKKFEEMSRQASFNHNHTVWALKCDIRKFFASIDHQILKNILSRYIEDKELLWLFGKVIDSFYTAGREGVGLPLGNLTSQLLVNVYMNEFDQFVKSTLKIKFYVRYADDFIFLDQDRDKLVKLLPKLEDFLIDTLKLTMHPKKVFLKTLASGVDFLGWIQFTEHRVLRTTTKHRMFKKLRNDNKSVVANAYLALLKYGAAHKLKKKIGLADRVL